MNLIGKVIFGLVGMVLVVYLIIPSPDFPEPLSDSVQSLEEADTETSLRRAYFTNFTREEIIAHYRDQFGGPLIRLNYPPEEAQTLIRDQTRSWYLEELVRPGRESLFVNGFIAQQEKDDIWYKGKHYEQKITIKYVPSALWARMLVLIMIVVVSCLLYVEWGRSLREIVKMARG
jgi:hypothetical protein